MKYASQISPETVARLAGMAEADPKRFNLPHPCPGKFVTREDTEFWCYKCWVHQLETGMEGYDVEGFLAKQNLSFDLPAGFIPEKKISISHGSDLMAVDCIREEYTPHLFDGIRDFYLTADLPTANLESTVYAEAPFGRNQPAVPKGETKTACSPRMNTSAGMLDKFVDAGIKYFSLANNHCYDYDEPGLRATQDELDARHVAWSGTNRRPEDQRRALVMEVGGIRVAQLSATFDINGRECADKTLLNEVRFDDTPCDLSILEAQIADAHAQQADLIILHAHWGWEFEMYPHPKVIDMAHRLAEMGVDVIVGTHPHVSQQMEKYDFTQNGEAKRCLIFYSLGDFVSFHPMTKNSRLTYVARYDAVKGTLNGKAKTFVTGLKILPVYILAACDENEDYDFRLLRFSDVLADTPNADGKYRYNLQDWERADLPRLRDVVLKKILLPENPGDLVAE